MDHVATRLINEERRRMAEESRRSKQALEDWRAQDRLIRLPDGRVVHPMAGGSLQTFQETLVASSIAGTSFGLFTTAKTVIPPICLFQFPPNYFYIGKVLRLCVTGGIGTVVTTPGTISFQVMIAAVIAWTSGAIQLNATAHTNLPFSLNLLLTCRAIGSGTAANILGQAVLTGVMFTGTATTVDAWGTNVGFTAGAKVSDAVINAPITAPAAGTGFDSTIANVLDFFVGFSISNAANTVKVEQYIVEALN